MPTLYFTPFCKERPMFTSVSSASIRTHLIMHNVLDTSTNVLDATKFALISDKVGRVLKSKDQVVQAPIETHATSAFYLMITKSMAIKTGTVSHKYTCEWS